MWSGAGTAIFAISVAALVLAAPCTALAWYGFVLIGRGLREVESEHHPHHHEALRTAKQLRGDDWGRQRFTALCSALVGSGFLVGVIFVWLAPWLVGPCGKWY